MKTTAGALSLLLEYSIGWPTILTKLKANHQCLCLQEVDAAKIRLKLKQMHPKGEAKVTKSNFLTAEFHWHSILKLLGADPIEYTVVVLNDSRKQGACHGHGRKQIVIENLGNQHFQPLLVSA